MVGEETSDEERDQIREDLGLNDPVSYSIYKIYRQCFKR